jgi:WD40 repeat protein
MQKAQIALACLVLSLGIGFSLEADAPKKAGDPQSDPLPHRLQPTRRCVLGEPCRCDALAFSPDGTRLLAGRDTGNGRKCLLTEWDLKKQSVLRSYSTGDKWTITTIAYNSSGDAFIIAHYDGFVSVRDRNGKTLQAFSSTDGPSESFLCLAAITDGPDPYVYTVTEHALAQRRSVTTNRTNIYPLDFSSTYHGTATRDGRCFVLDSWNGVHLCKDGFSSPPKALESARLSPVGRCVAISDDGRTVMLGNEAGEFVLIDVLKDSVIKRWKVDKNRAANVIIPFHGRNGFVTGSVEGEIALWTQQGKLVATCKSDDDCITALALRKDNKLLAAVGLGGPIVLWDLSSQQDKGPARKDVPSK